MPLDHKDRERLSRLLGMFGSDYDGEVLNAARAAHKLIKGKGETWETIITTAVSAPRPNQQKQREYRPEPPDYIDEIDLCMLRPNLMTPWEREFLVSLKASGRATPTEKQRAILDRIKAKMATYAGMNW